MKKSIFGSLLSLLIFSVSVMAQKPVTVKKNNPKLTNIADGKGIYTKYCLTCHQADGGGVQNMNPPLIQTSYVLGDKNRLAKIVLNGFNEEVEINGDVYTNAMPAFNHLTDKQIADVLTYVRNSFTNKASVVTVAEVKKARAPK